MAGRALGSEGLSKGVTGVHLTFGSRAPSTMSHLSSLAPIALILPFYKRFNRQSSDSAICEPPKRLSLDVALK